MIKIFKLLPFFALISVGACNITLSDSVNPYSKSQSGGFTHYDAEKNEFRIYYKGPMGQGETKSTEILKSEAQKLAIKNGADWYRIDELNVQSMRKNYFPPTNTEYDQKQREKDKLLTPEQISAETTYYVSAYLKIGKNPMPQGAASVK